MQINNIFNNAEISFCLVFRMSRVWVSTTICLAAHTPIEVGHHYDQYDTLLIAQV
jgi:ribosomal protein L16 Arg81 hydroxylase